MAGSQRQNAQSVVISDGNRDGISIDNGDGTQFLSLASELKKIKPFFLSPIRSYVCNFFLIKRLAFVVFLSTYI